MRPPFVVPLSLTTMSTPDKHLFLHEQPLLVLTGPLGLTSLMADFPRDSRLLFPPMSTGDKHLYLHSLSCLLHSLLLFPIGSHLKIGVVLHSKTTFYIAIRLLRSHGPSCGYVTVPALRFAW